MSDHFDTDRPGNPRADDELVSAVLDGEASADERARVLDDPELRRRLEAFESVAASVADLAPVDPEVRDVTIARVLDLAGTEVADDEEASRPVPFDRARSLPARAAPWLAAAAVLALIVPLGVLLIRDGGGEGEGDQQAATTEGDARSSVEAETSPTDEEVADEEAFAADGGDVFETGSLQAAGAVDLGELATVDDLRRAAAAALAAPASRLERREGDGEAPASVQSLRRRAGGALPCEASLRAGGDPSLGETVGAATAVYQGVPVVVLVVAGTDGSGSQIVVALTPPGCEERARTAL